MRDFLDDEFSDDSLEESRNPQPQSCFGQKFEKYVGRLLVTTIILDGSDWIMFNRQDETYATTLEAELGEKNIVSSIGTAGFISTMEPNSEDSSGAGTVFEVATKEDIAELQRYAYEKFLEEFDNHILYFRVTNWLQGEMFDVCMLPMGDLAYHLGIRPVVALSIEGDGILCREGLPLDFEEITHACNVLPKHENWALVYELFYVLDPNIRFKSIMAGGRDPLMLLGELLQRFVDEMLDHRVCLACKYPP